MSYSVTEVHFLSNFSFVLNIQFHLARQFQGTGSSSSGTTGLWSSSARQFMSAHLAAVAAATSPRDGTWQLICCTRISATPSKGAHPPCP